MRGKFGPDDERAFLRAKQELEREFESRPRAGGSAEESWVVGLLLDYKWGYSDGDLFRWDLEEVADFLLGWFPRKATVEEDDLQEVIPALQSWIGFLADTERLRSPYEPLVLIDEVGDMRQAFFEAATDPSNFGLAKSLFATMSSEGVDVDDQLAVQKWIGDFNERPFEERDRLLPGAGAAEPEPLQFPPVKLPPREELKEMASSSAAVADLKDFVDFIGGGRRLTHKGNLTLADGRKLMEVLDTGDSADEQIGDRVFKTQSTEELTGVHLTFRWAVASGFAKVRHKKVSSTVRGRALGADLLDDLGLAFAGLMNLGPCTTRHPDSRRRFWSEDLDALLPTMLSYLYAQSEPVPVEDLLDIAWEDIELSYEMPDPGEFRFEAWRIWMQSDIEFAFGAFHRLGVARLRDDRVSLTSLGLWVTGKVLNGLGFEAPVVEDPADMATKDAGSFLYAAVYLEPDELETAAKSWCAARGAAAASELLAAIETSDERALQLLGLNCLDHAGDEAEAAVRHLQEHSELRPYATMWLVSHGLEGLDAVTDEDRRNALVTQFTFLVEHGPPGALAEVVLGLGPADEVAAIVDDLWHATVPETEDVLERLGRLPSKPVAKAARKALFKHRSANPL